MPTGLTNSEVFVNSISERAFLKLWTHPNPKGKKGKELCDCLIVCGNHVIIISVKDIQYKDTGDKTGMNRWGHAAIEKSASQIWGAERWLIKARNFERHDGRIVELPSADHRIYHRISVSLGAKRQILTKSGDLGHGIIHICDEFSIGAIFGLLDTVSDFVDFFTAIEGIFSRGASLVFNGGGIEDLLAIYISNDYSFPFGNQDTLIIDRDIFTNFVESNEYTSLQKNYKDSYFWDRLLNWYIDDYLTDGMFDLGSKKVSESQHALIEMALQPRYVRLELSKIFVEFHTNPELDLASRAVRGCHDTAFVFLIGPSTDREKRAQELAMRCLVIRGRIPEVQTVVGIAMDRIEPSSFGNSSDLVFIRMLNWTDEDEKRVVEIQDSLGYFEKLKTS